MFAGLRRAFHRDQLRFHGDCLALADEKNFTAFLGTLFQQHWVAHSDTIQRIATNQPRRSSLLRDPDPLGEVTSRCSVRIPGYYIPMRHRSQTCVSRTWKNFCDVTEENFPLPRRGGGTLIINRLGRKLGVDSSSPG